MNNIKTGINTGLRPHVYSYICTVSQRERAQGKEGGKEGRREGSWVDASVGGGRGGEIEREPV